MRRVDELSTVILDAMAAGVRYNTSNVVKLLGGRGIHPTYPNVLNALYQLVKEGRLKQIPSYKTTYFIK
jgi:hypothetical protein